MGSQTEGRQTDLRADPESQPSPTNHGVPKSRSDSFTIALDRFCSSPRYVWGAVGLLLAMQSGLLAYSATRHSPTRNEPAHLVAGLSHWRFGRYELYRVNPPLVHYVAALPVVVAGYQADWTGYYEGPGARPVDSMSSDFMAANGVRSIWLITIARWTCIPICLIGGLFCFLWSRELWNSNLGGLITLTLWCFDPNVLAHGELITPDTAAASFGLGAGYLFWRWLRVPTWGRALAAGSLLGLAELSKMTWVILFGLWPVLWLFWFWTKRRHLEQTNSISESLPLASRPRSPYMQLSQLITILLWALCWLNLGYLFDGTFTQLGDLTFVSSTFTGEAESGTPGNRFTGTWLGALRLPFPKQYLLGMDIQKHDFEDFRSLSYLRGEWKEGGWWYYYLYGLAVKMPHGTQFLLLLSVLLLLFHRGADEPSSSQRVCWRDLIILLAPPLCVMVLVSSQLEFNHHLRYVLPVFGYLFVLIGCVGSELVVRRRGAALHKSEDDE